MPRNGTGIYTPFTPGNPVVANTTIDPAVENSTITDLATALTNSVARNGEATATGNWPMGTFKLTGLGAGSATNDSIAFGQSGALLATPTFTGDTNGLGIAISRSKPSSTSRATTTTPTSDPDLTCALTVAIATWAVDIWLPIWGTGSGAAGIKLDISFTGTTPSSLFALTGVINNAVAAAYQAQTGAVVFSAATITSAASTPDWVRLSGTLSATTTGTLSLQWSQNTSSGSAINIGQGAWMNVTRVA